MTDDVEGRWWNAQRGAYDQGHEATLNRTAYELAAAKAAYKAEPTERHRESLDQCEQAYRKARRKVN